MGARGWEREGGSARVGLPHLGVGALAVAHLRVLLVAVEREELVDAARLQRQPRQLQPEGP
eukprot:7387692-Prymnesium_polylepis.1